MKLGLFIFRVMFLLLTILFVSRTAYAQAVGCDRVIQNGTVVNGQAVVFVAPCLIAGAGGSNGSSIVNGPTMITDFGVLGKIGILDGPTTGAYHQALLSWNGNAFDINLNSFGGAGTPNGFLVINGGIPIPLGGGGGGSIVGLTPGQVPIAGSATTLTSSVPVGTIGNSTIVQTNGAGTIANSLVSALPIANLATSGALPVADLNFGVGATSTTFWRGDGVWATPTGGGNVTGPGSSTNGFVPTWSGTSGTILATGLPVGTTGNSTIVETNSSGLIANSLVSALPIANLATTGALPVTDLNSGTGASSSTFWRGDGTWATPPSGSGTVSGPPSSTNGFIPQWNGTTGTVLGTGLPVGTTGNSTVVETSSGGTISNTLISVLPIANLATTGALPVTDLNSGTGATSSTFWRGDGTWATPAGAALTVTDGTNSVTSVTSETFGKGFLVSGSAGAATVNDTNVIKNNASATYTILSTDANTEVDGAATSGTQTYTLPDATTSGFGTGFAFTLCAESVSITLNRTTTSTINTQTSLPLDSYQCDWIRSDGTNYLAAPVGQALPYVAEWVATVNPNNKQVFRANAPMLITAVVGTVETAVGATATIAINYAASGTACSGGTAITTATFNANGTAATDQTLTLSSPPIVLPAGTRVCLQTANGSNFTSGTGAGQINVYARKL